MAKSKQARAREFSTKTRKEISVRDNGQCIFCKQNYHMEKATWFSQSILSVMHYIPRSRNGLGTAKNGAIGCQYHHTMLDNGNEGLREEMLGIFKKYLMNQYPDWNEEELVYSRWN